MDQTSQSNRCSLMTHMVQR